MGAPKEKEIHVDVPFGATIVLRQVTAPQAAPDELVEIHATGLELRAVLALIKDGTLPSAKIGRRSYCKRSDLVRLVDKLATAPAKKPKPAKAETSEPYTFDKAIGGR